MFVSLNCYSCDNPDCLLCPLGKFIDNESKEGCTRELSEDMYAKYEHVNNEVLPFAFRNKNIDFQEVDRLNNYIYRHCRIGTMLDEKGKAIKTKKKIIDKLNQQVI